MNERFFGEKTGKLGFGMMRLPRNGDEIDIEQSCKMVDIFMENGFTYFDTAFVYNGSEVATRKTLVERYPREAFTLASKVYAVVVEDEESAKKEIETSLERTGAGYLDYYLLHSLDNGNYEKYDKFHLWDFVKEEKAKGRIKHYGFSFHGTPELLEKLLTEHPDVEFVQLQINYADWENPDVKSREIYEIARKHGKSIVVMEPVRGGKLADPPEEVKRIFDAVNPNASYASWAIRFVASLDGIITILSGMSTVEQVEDNVSFMKNYAPLNDEEKEAIKKAQAVFRRSHDIPCTACRYCTDGCPMDINIPEIFKAKNKLLSSENSEEAENAYKIATEQSGKASACISCGQCEAVCPQKIDIINQLKGCVDSFEKE